MRKAIAFAATALLAAAPARADTVCEWMEFAAKIEAAGVEAQQLTVRTGQYDRVQTQVALAMFEALNAIDRRYESYLKIPTAEPGASQEIAAATAAYHVLQRHFPSQKAALDDSYSMIIEGERDVVARDGGIRIGLLAAEAALGRGLVGSTPLTHYRPRVAPGVWGATQLPVFAPGFLAQKPWFIGRADAFRPGPPPALTSEVYARDVNELKAIGGKKSQKRTDHQARMARYRINADLLPAFRQVTDQAGRRLVDNARLFTLYGMIDDDVMLASADAKLHYNFWRPVTAIRNAAEDGNPATEPDPSWEPLITTPNHPEYPCAHCTQAAATAELMKSEYGNSPASGVRIASSSSPKAVLQVLPTWDRWAKEVSDSRKYGGVHYQFSNDVGEDMGRKIARAALTRVMRPLK